MAVTPGNGGGRKITSTRTFCRTFHLVWVKARGDNRGTRSAEELHHYLCDLMRGLARSIDGFGETLAKEAMVVDLRECEVAPVEVTQLNECVCGVE
jgi:hypothetical protein